MENSLLIPGKYKVIGWIIFILFACLGLATLYWDYKIPGLVLPLKESVFVDYNLTNELALAGLIIGLMIIVFAREKIEDEYISLIRLKCLQWSVLISFVILFILNFVFYGGSFYIVLIYNMFTIPLIFIAKFNYSLYRLRREREEDEK
jgi:FlaA1/EpsC-like NDP-sugar epimerase